MDKQIEKVEDAIKKTDAMKEKMTDAQAEVGTMAGQLVELQLQYDRVVEESKNKASQIAELLEKMPVIEHERDLLKERVTALEADINSREEMEEVDVADLVRYRVEEEIAKNSLDLKVECKRLKKIIKGHEYTIDKLEWDLDSQAQQFKMYKTHADEAGE